MIGIIIIGLLVLVTILGVVDVLKQVNEIPDEK